MAKSFGATQALRGVSLDLYGGQVCALVGENGAGKTTLVNILLGIHRPDAGALSVRGKLTRLGGPTQARALGIVGVHQEFSLVSSAPVWENLFLGREPTRLGVLRRRQMRGAARDSLQALGSRVDLDRTVQELSRAEQQQVEICKGFVERSSNGSVVLLDEPTASLTQDDVERLFTMIRRLRDHDLAVVYITHRLREVFDICDRVIVLRGGRLVSDRVASETTEDEVVADMTGGLELARPRRRERQAGIERVLEIRNLSTSRVADVSLEVGAGEVVGLAGCVGSGAASVINAMTGVEPTIEGEIRVLGKEVRRPTPRRILEMGVAIVPPDRRQDGLFPGRSIMDNLVIEGLGRSVFVSRLGVLRLRKLNQEARAVMERVRLPVTDISAPVENLSGGQQQKALLGRALMTPKKLFLLQDPTVGVDVGTRADIYRELAELSGAGAAVILASSDFREVADVCDRVYVFHNGRVVADYARPDITEAGILEAAVRRRPQSPPSVDSADGESRILSTSDTDCEVSPHRG